MRFYEIYLRQCTYLLPDAAQPMQLVVLTHSVAAIGTPEEEEEEEQQQQQQQQTQHVQRQGTGKERNGQWQHVKPAGKTQGDIAGSCLSALFVPLSAEAIAR